MLRPNVPSSDDSIAVVVRPNIPSLSAKEKLSPYVSEFVGTFVLVFATGCCINNGDKTWTATSVGLLLMAVTYSVAHVSMGCLNPSVSLTMWLTKKMDTLQLFFYVAVQILAGAAAGLLIAFMFKKSSAVGPVAPFSMLEATFVEFLYTTILCLVFVNVTGSMRKNPPDDPNQFFALAIGFVIIAGGHAVGDISGAYFNPALSIGLDLANVIDFSSFRDTLKLGSSLWYLLAEVLGAFGAASLFQMFRHREYSVNDWQELIEHRAGLMMRLGTEFVGTGILILTFGLNFVLGHSSSAWSAGAAYACVIYALGDISGGHFNPAVTTAVVLSGRGKLSFGDAFFYMLAQCTAGLLCSLLMAHFHVMGPASKTALGIAADPTDYGWWQIGITEFVFTGLLAYVFLCVSTTRLPSSWSTSQNFYYAFAIGACLTVGGIASGAVTGGCMNPAISLGIGMEESSGILLRYWRESETSITTGAPSAGPAHAMKLCNFLYYVMFQLLGATFATLLFHVTHSAEYTSPWK